MNTSEDGRRHYRRELTVGIGYQFVIFRNLCSSQPLKSLCSLLYVFNLLIRPFALLELFYGFGPAFLGIRLRLLAYVGLAQTRVQGIQRVLEGAENDDLLAAGRICWTNVIAA
ncbi:MAG: hypothetical protein ABSE48_12600 [Verrucomicrobiota bacterium]